MEEKKTKELMLDQNMSENPMLEPLLLKDFNKMMQLKLNVIKKMETKEKKKMTLKKFQYLLKDNQPDLLLPILLKVPYNSNILKSLEKFFDWILLVKVNNIYMSKNV